MLSDIFCVITDIINLFSLIFRIKITRETKMYVSLMLEDELLSKHHN